MKRILGVVGAWLTLALVGLFCQTQVSQNDWLAISAPGSPASGLFRFYAKTGTGFCQKTSGGVETCIGSGSSAEKVRPCEIAIGTPGAGSPVLASDDDVPQICSNDTGATMTITGVHCYADAGGPTVTPIITGGSGTSILSGALTCNQTSGGAAGTLNGTPTQTNGQLIDANITTAGGTAKYVVIRITRTL